jgi:hypothetical protein
MTVIECRSLLLNHTSFFNSQFSRLERQYKASTQLKRHLPLLPCQVRTSYPAHKLSAMEDQDHGHAFYQYSRTYLVYQPSQHLHLAIANL